MDNRVPPFIKRDKDSLLFNSSGEFLFYVPEVMFERKIAQSFGDYIRVLGVIDYQLVDANGKKGKIIPFNFPSVFLTSPSHVEKKKEIQINKHNSPSDYRILHYTKGDKIVLSTKVPQIIDNAEEFYKLFLNAKLPTTIPYDKLPDYFIDNMNLNGGNYGLDMQIFGIIVSEVCRDPNNKDILFCHTDMKDMNAYNFISIKEIPHHISPFTAITSENLDESLVNGITNKAKAHSPLEKLMMEQNIT